MEIVAMFFPPLMMILLGVAIGMYISSQIEGGIKRNIKNNEKEKIKQQEPKILGQKPVNWTENKEKKTFL